MRQELANLSFVYEPHFKPKDNLQKLSRTYLFLYQDTNYLLQAWAADSETDLLTFFESDRELTAEVFYMTAFRSWTLYLLLISPILRNSRQKATSYRLRRSARNLYNFAPNTRTKRWQSAG